jgi:hypothetical protein
MTFLTQYDFNILDISLIVVQVDTTSSTKIIILVSRIFIYFLFILNAFFKFFSLSFLDNLACCLVFLIFFIIFFSYLIHKFFEIFFANNSD